MQTMSWKSIRAVIAGVIVILVVTTLVDIVLHAAGIFPSLGQPLNDALSILALSYRLVIGIAGAWLTAWLAPGKPMKHAMILGCVGVVLALAGVIATWNMGLGPRWYPLSLVVLAIPQCWAGGRIHQMQAGRP
jgi:hypothetical protein